MHQTKHRYIDLSRLITDKMPVYPGDAPVCLENTVDIKTHGVANQHLSCGMHIGTHIDSPSHMIEGGKRLTDFPLDTFFAQAVLIDARGRSSIDVDLLEGKNLKPGQALLICTDWDGFYGRPHYFSSYPAITKEFAQCLIDAQISFIGMDTPSPDYHPYGIHKLLLSHDILIIENLINLKELAQLSAFEVIALPLKIEADGALARVVARI